MARTPVLKNIKRVNFTIEGALHQAAQKRCATAGYSFSDYVARLLNADLQRRNTIAHRFPRRHAI